MLVYVLYNEEHYTLHLKRASCGLWLIERGILHLKRACFCAWLIERGMLHLKRASFNEGLIKRGNYISGAHLLVYGL